MIYVTKSASDGGFQENQRLLKTYRLVRIDETQDVEKLLQVMSVFVVFMVS